MTRPPITCADALTILLDDVSPKDAEAVQTARRHATSCVQCVAVFDDPATARQVLDRLRSRRPTETLIIRVTLVVLASVQIVVASPWLVGASLIPDQHVAVSHLTRDGALGLVIAVLGLLVAWRPRYALAALLIGSIVLAAQFTTGLIDDRSQSVSLAFELVHLLVFVILALIAAIGSATRSPAPPPSRRERLRSV